MWIEPGPFADRDQAPDDRPIVRPGTFAAALDIALPHLDAGDRLLGSSHRDIATVTDAGLDTMFVGTIGHAAQLADEQRNAGNDVTADVLTWAGGAADSLHDGSLRYLPPPSTPIETNFSEPPPPPMPPSPPPPPPPTDGATETLP